MGQCNSNEQLTNVQMYDSPTEYQKLDYNRYSTYQKLETIASDIVESQQLNSQFTQLIQRIIAGRQDHILKMLSSQSPEEKRNFIQKIEFLDLETIDSLYYHCYQKSQLNVFRGKLAKGEINRELGLQLIRERKAGIIILAGGKSSRLPNKVLADFGLPSRKCPLQLLLEKLKKIIYMGSPPTLSIAQEDCDEPMSLEQFPIGILLSDINGMAIKQFIKNKKDFGFQNIHFMYQKSLPILNLSGQVLFTNNEPALSPDGAGNVLPQLQTFIQKYPNLKSIHLLGCDNLSGLPLDPDMLGMEADIICKVVETQLLTDDKLYYQNGWFKTIEVQDSSMTENPDNILMCLNDMYVDIGFLNSLKTNHEKALRLAQRYHAIKRQSSLIFEKHIQDIIEIADTTILHQIDDCALLCNDTRKALFQISNQHKKWLKIEGTCDEDIVEISANMSYAGEDLKLKFDLQFPLII